MRHNNYDLFMFVSCWCHVRRVYSEERAVVEYGAEGAYLSSDSNSLCKYYGTFNTSIVHQYQSINRTSQDTINGYTIINLHIILFIRHSSCRLHAVILTLAAGFSFYRHLFYLYYLSDSLSYTNFFIFFLYKFVLTCENPTEIIIQNKLSVYLYLSFFH